MAQKIKLDGQEFTWKERQLIVRSFAIAETEEKSLRERLQKTSSALELLKKPRLGKKKLTSVDQWEASVAAILKRYRTDGLFKINLQVTKHQKTTRRYLDRLPQTREETSINLDFEIVESAVAFNAARKVSATFSRRFKLRTAAVENIWTKRTGFNTPTRSTRHQRSSNKACPFCSDNVRAHQRIHHLPRQQTHPVPKNRLRKRRAGKNVVVNQDIRDTVDIYTTRRNVHRCSTITQKLVVVVERN